MKSEIPVRKPGARPRDGPRGGALTCGARCGSPWGRVASGYSLVTSSLKTDTGVHVTCRREHRVARVSDLGGRVAVPHPTSIRGDPRLRHLGRQPLAPRQSATARAHAGPHGAGSPRGRRLARALSFRCGFHNPVQYSGVSQSQKI